jgi:phosphopantetheine--protein transferase-like protein
MEDIKRFADKKSDASFLNMVFTKDEQEYCLAGAKPERHLSARWCAKEAAVKALSGLGLTPPEYNKIEIVMANGAPAIKIGGLDDLESSVSMSHCQDKAMAVVIINRK